jgi:hypothetical protein
MIFYNITTKIDELLAKDWLAWQRELQIPEILATNHFDDHRIFHLLDQDESDGITFTVQFITDSAARYEAFLKDHASRFNHQAAERWQQHFVYFQSSMELVQ